MKYRISFIYTALVTVIYFMYLYEEDISLLMSLIIPAVFFLPILLALTNMELNLKKMNLVILSAFITGFIVSAFISSNNIWPIALITWLVISIPALFLLNMTCYVHKRIRA